MSTSSMRGTTASRNFAEGAKIFLNSTNRLQKLISMTLIAALFMTQLISPIALAQTSDQYRVGFSHGREDGQFDASLAKIVWGIFLGPAALLYNMALVKELPIDRASEISDRPDDYRKGYLVGYQSGFKQRSVYYSLIGWSTWALFYVVLQALRG